MSLTPTSPLPGATITGLTSPTYTLTEDVAPSSNGLQWAVTSLGGTQTDVDTHSVAKPFTLSVFRPVNLKSLGVPNKDGYYTTNGKNTYKVITRKGMDITSSVAGQPPQVGLLNTELVVPAGSGSADLPAIRAALSCHIGALVDLIDGLSDAAQTGLI